MLIPASLGISPILGIRFVVASTALALMGISRLDIKMAAKVFEEAARFFFYRFRACFAWAFCVQHYHPCSVLDPYRLAFDLLPSMAWLCLPVTDRLPQRGGNLSQRSSFSLKQKSNGWTKDILSFGANFFNFAPLLMTLSSDILT